MNKLDLNDPAIKDFLNDPKVKDLQVELTDYITAEYAKFDNTDFVGESAAGLVKVYYSFGKKGFFKVEVADKVYTDKAFTCDLLPAAMNDALIKYHAENKVLEQRLIAKENDLYVRLVNIAMEKRDITTEPKTNMSPNKKTYLN